MSNQNNLYSQAVEYYLSNNLTKAMSICQKILQKNQKDDKALNLYGLIMLSQGKNDQAVSMFSKAIVSNQKNVEAVSNLANAYKASGMLEKALDTYQYAIKQNPNFEKAYYNAAVVLSELERYDEAVYLFQKTIEICPDFFDAYLSLSAILKQEGDILGAIELLKKAPINDKTKMARALLYSSAKEHDTALGLIEQLLKTIQNCDVYANYGIVLFNAKKYEEAKNAYLRALSFDNQADKVYSNLSNCLVCMGELKTAKGAIVKAISLNPGFADHYVNLGVLLKKCGEMAEAELSFLKAIEIDAKNKAALTNLGILKMFFGDYGLGFKLYENRSKPLVSSMISKTWEGQSIDGKKLLVYHEQGFGDTLNFARLLQDEKLKNVSIYFLPQKELFALFRSSTLDCIVLEASELHSGELKFDYHVPLLSLLSILDIRHQSIPRCSNYIIPDILKVSRIKNKLSKSNRKKIGIAWQGNKEYSGDSDRSSNLEYFTKFFLNRFDIVSLQKDIDSMDRDVFANSDGMYDFSSDIVDFVDTVAIIQNVDFVVTVDTSVAHLSGVCGVQTFLMLPLIPDWRWGNSGESSDWYDNFILVRQIESGNWEFCFEKIVKLLS